MSVLESSLSSNDYTAQHNSMPLLKSTVLARVTKTGLVLVLNISGFAD